MKNYEKNKKLNLEAHPNGKINSICESIQKMKIINEILVKNIVYTCTVTRNTSKKP